jgi:hypothetical protein
MWAKTSTQPRFYSGFLPVFHSPLCKRELRREEEEEEEEEEN